MTTKNQGRLELSAKEMKTLGYEVIDMLVEHFIEVGNKPTKKRIKKSELETLLIEQPPVDGSDALDLLHFLRDQVFADLEQKIHPRDFAFIPGPSNFVSVMADTVASGYNVFSGAEMTSSAATIIETLVTGWLCEMFGFGKDAGGLFVSGGSAANLTGLAVARNHQLGDVVGKVRVYFSEQTHVSNNKALKLLGFQAEHLCKLPTDENYRIDMKQLEQQITKDLNKGIQPFCIIANAGTTNTGAVDPLEQLADICTEHNMWLHVDGAYGAAAALTDRGAPLLAGMNRADSLAFDPHKWFFQPYEIGGVIVRDMKLLQRTFATSAEYLRDIQDTEEPELNFFDYGIQMTRGFRALKMWMSIKTFGFNAIKEAIARGIQLAEVTETALKASSKWEIVSPAHLGIITFRYVIPAAGESIISEINQKIVESMIADGFAFVLSTSLRDKTVLRMCTINPRTTDDEIRQTIHKLEQFGDEAAQQYENKAMVDS